MLCGPTGWSASLLFDTCTIKIRSSRGDAHYIWVSTRVNLSLGFPTKRD